MTDIPFGVSRLDSIIGGGVPAGNVVLLVGEAGAGAREFLYTSAAMTALSHADPELFDLYYGDLADDARLPPEVHYLSFTADKSYIEREMAYTMDDEIVDAAVDRIQFRDFSPEYFQLSPIPRDWYMEETTSLQDLGTRHDRDGVVSALGDYLSAHASENLVLVDSISDLAGAVDDDLTWNDITMLMRGLMKAAHQWVGLSSSSGSPGDHSEHGRWSFGRFGASSRDSNRRTSSASRRRSTIGVST